MASLQATDLAEHLVLQGIPFRTCHELVGKAVKYCEEHDLTLEDLTEESLQGIDECLTGIPLPDLSMEGSIYRRNSFGSTAPTDVARQISAGWDMLKDASII